MPLAHFTNIESHYSKWEPIYQNLFEIDIILPDVLRPIHPDATSLLLQNATKVTLPAYKDLEVVKQFFKYSSRICLKTPSDTSLENINITFNVNQNDGKQMFTFRMIKDWYDLSWNNEDGSLHYKKNCVGEMVLYQHDKEGQVIRRITYHNVLCKMFSLGDAVDWSQNDVFTCEATFAADYWEDYYF